MHTIVNVAKKFVCRKNATEYMCKRTRQSLERQNLTIPDRIWCLQILVHCLKDLGNSSSRRFFNVFTFNQQGLRNMSLEEIKMATTRRETGNHKIISPLVNELRLPLLRCITGQNVRPLVSPLSKNLPEDFWTLLDKHKLLSGGCGGKMFNE